MDPSPKLLQVLLEGGVVIFVDRGIEPQGMKIAIW